MQTVEDERRKTFPKTAELPHCGTGSPPAPERPRRLRFFETNKERHARARAQTMFPSEI